MRIVDHTDKRLPFNTIPNGYLFEYDGEIFMTTRPFKLQDANEYNAVCLADGLLYTLKPEVEVVPIIGQLEIIKKGTYQQ